MRLTYELGHKGSGEYDTDNTRDMLANNLIKALNKLGQLEDIEDELGVDLVTLFKAFQDGIWYKKENGETDRSRSLSLTDLPWELNTLEGRAYGEVTTDCATVSLSDYGKTWALTEAELEGKE